jgi:hypothetical protein
MLASPGWGPCLQAIAVRADLYTSDVRVRQMVSSALDAGPAEIRLWGEGWPADLDSPADPVRHRLSVAARAFKAQALAAAAVPVNPGEDTEVFRGAHRRQCLVSAH